MPYCVSAHHGDERTNLPVTHSSDAQVPRSCQSDRYGVVDMEYVKGLRKRCVGSSGRSTAA